MAHAEGTSHLHPDPLTDPPRLTEHHTRWEYPPRPQTQSLTGYSLVDVVCVYLSLRPVSGCSAFPAEGVGSIPGLGTKIYKSKVLAIHT